MKLARILLLSAPLWVAAEPLPAADQSPIPSPAGLPAAQVEQIQAVVRDYLRQHPEVIIEAIKAYQAQQDADQAAKAKQDIVAFKDEIFRDAASPVGGNPEGDVTIVEFFDYRCPYCKAVAGDLNKAVTADGKVRMVYKEFPILGPSSVVAARAALASQAQGKYVAFHDRLMSLKGSLDDAAIFAAAADVGLDVPRLKADMEKPAVAEQIDRTRSLADKLAIQGTPAFVIGAELLPGAASLEELTAAIKRARAGG